MEPTAAKPFRLADFRPFLHDLREEPDQPAVIGGMAVSAWADRFLLKSEHPQFDIRVEPMKDDTGEMKSLRQDS